MNKNILFRLPSASGDFACVNGEIERAENVTFLLADGNVAPRASALVEMMLPPAPVVRFGLQPEIVKGWHNHIDNLPSKIVEAPSKPSDETWREEARKVFVEYERDAAEEGLFTRPFFALSAVRLRSGDRILPGMPVLLIPQRIVPYVSGSDNFNLPTMEMTIKATASRLRMKVQISPDLLNPDLEAEALEIFVSSPLTTFHDEEWISLHRSSLTDGEPQAWRPRPHTEIEVAASMLECSSFRPVGSIDLHELTTDSSWMDVIFNIPPVTGAGGALSYRPDYLQLQDVKAAGHSIISKRLTLWDLTLTSPTAPSLATLMHNNMEEEQSGSFIDMEMLKEGRVMHSVKYNPSDTPVLLTDDFFPQWLFFPDKDIRNVTIVTAGGCYRVKTHPHPTLEGSYFCCGDFTKTTVTELGVEKLNLSLSDIPYNDYYESRPTYSLSDAVWRSGRGSRYFFADKLLMRVDDSRVIALCRAFRASGLVATTAPTAYLFTTGGIYLVREMEDGTFRDVGLIAAYVLRDASSISVDGRTLRFVDTEGRIFIISGTSVKPAESTEGSGDTGSDLSRPGKTTVIIESDGTGMPIKVITRPIKLGDAVKNLFTVELLGTSTCQEIELTLYGSRDMSDWQPLASICGKVLHGIYAPGLRYCRLELTGSLTGTIEGFGITC